MSMTPQTDKQLIQNYLNGDDKSFEILLTRHKEKIYTSIYLFVKDRDQADDIFQEVFIKIIKTLRKGKYNHEGKFLQWAMRISYNLCVDHFRRSKRRTKVSPTETFDIFDVLELKDENMEQQMMKSQTHDKVRKLVDLLPDEQREVV
nr:sigma-70 family RNA polymerase sigma factor [Saprospiraceae bacterium]